jgi:ribosomal protein S18 acetylase RimI-like enzyme
VTVEIREFQPVDYDAVLELWRASPGVTLRDADAREPLMAYIRQNVGLSFVAKDADQVVGAVLCGTDGRRGYLQHLAVAASHRRRGIGRALAERCVRALAERGIDKCHLMVVSGNHDATAFWTRLGWTDRADIRLMSHTSSGATTA